MQSPLSSKMGSNKIGSYIVNYRSKRKEAAEEERRRREQEFGKRPEIVDPSFELFGQRGQQQQQEQTFRSNSTPSQISPDDWVFQDRRTYTSSEQYQFEPYCEVTAKSSVSSTASKASTVPSQQDYDMGWDSYEQTRPRPQSYLPPIAPIPQPAFTSDYSGVPINQSRRHTMHPAQLRQPLMTSRTMPETKSTYKLEASLSKPFSMNDPLDFWSDPASPVVSRKELPFSKHSDDR